MASNRILIAWVIAAGLAAAASPATAQYMYLDANANGVHDSGDHLAPNGTPTTVDVWLDTNHKRDGSLVTCDVDPTQSLTLSDYFINLEAAGGLVTYSGFVTHFGNPPIGQFNPGDGIRYANGLVNNFTTLPPGLHLLATLTITATGGTPVVNIVDLVTGGVNATLFATSCFGNDFDNAYKLTGPAGGSDWTDVDGLGPYPGEVGPPVLFAIGNKTVNEGTCLIFTATAVAPNGSPVTFSLSAGAPAGASITTGGQFIWCPTEAQGPGVYTVTVCVVDNVTNLIDCETIVVTVLEVNLAPVLAAIGNKTGVIGVPITFTVTATDADLPANSLTFSLDPGAPAGATIDATTGVFTWVPITNGTFPVTIRVTDNGTPPLSDSEAILIVLGFGPASPVLQPIPNMTVDEGAVLTQTISASDPNNLTLTFTKISGPLWMTVTTTSPTTGLISLAPDFASAGSYTATVRASNGGLYDEKSFQILVRNVCRAPLADAGGPYAGPAGIPVAFDGTGSADPDGDALAYAWDFGDGTTGTGATPNHSYALTGLYLVSLHVTDPCGLSDDDTTTASIVQCSSAYAFTTGGNSRINLGSGKQASCIQIQPVNGSFTIESVDLSSIVMRSSGTGSVEEIHAQGTKTSLSGDRNNDGTDEIAACFTKSDLQQLFSGLTGTVDVGVTLEGDLQGGARFCTGLTLSVRAGGGGNLAASISPNPLNPSAVLTFTTQERGPLLVQLFDVRGRLLRTLWEESDAAAGYHDVRIDGTSANGSRLSSGIYFVRIRASMEEERRTITILK